MFYTNAVAVTITNFYSICVSFSKNKVGYFDITERKPYNKK